MSAAGAFEVSAIANAAPAGNRRVPSLDGVSARIGPSAACAAVTVGAEQVSAGMAVPVLLALLVSELLPESVPELLPEDVAPVVPETDWTGIQHDFDTLGSGCAPNAVWVQATPFVNVPPTTFCVGLRPNSTSDVPPNEQ